MCTQSFVALHIKKALKIFRELIPTTRRTTRVVFWDPPSGSKNQTQCAHSLFMPPPLLVGARGIMFLRQPSVCACVCVCVLPSVMFL